MRLEHFFALLCIVFLASNALAQGPGITIEFLQPDQGITYTNGVEITVEAKVTFPEGSTNQGAELFISNQENRVEEIELEKNAGGNYETTLQTSQETGTRLNLTVNATAMVNDGYLEEQDEISIDFEGTDIDLDFELIPAGPYYIGSTIEGIRINVYSDGSRVPLENFNRPSLQISRERQRIDWKTDAETGAITAEMDYKIKLTEEFMFMRNNSIDFELTNMREDRYGNKIKGDVMKKFDIEDSHDLLSLRIRNPPSHGRLFHSMQIPFAIEIEKDSSAKNVRVFVTDGRDIENMRQCQKARDKENIFICQEKLPSMDEESRLTYLALAAAEISGKEVTVYEMSEIEVSNIIYLRLGSLPEGKSIEIDDVEDKVKLEFYYSERAALQGGSYNGTINGTPVEFAWDPNEKMYIADFDLKTLGEGMHDLRFEVEGIELDEDTISVEFVPVGSGPGPGPNPNLPGGNGDSKAFDMFIVIGAVVVVFALFTLITWFLVLRKKREETIDELKEEAAMQKEMLKRLEIDYYKRRVNELEYKKRVLEYQTRLDRTVAKMKAKGAMEKDKKKKREK